MNGVIADRILRYVSRPRAGFACRYHIGQGARLATQAKGIYKPRYTDFALSVRQTLDSPCADKEVVRRDDGSWVYPYFQENGNSSQRDAEATNRGLMKCMEEGIPVGVLMQTKPKPGVEYNVLGLATVAEWRDGYFHFGGVLRQGRIAFQRPDDRRSV